MNRAPDNSDGTGRTDAPNGAETDQLLLPGWSSLVILLIIFGVLSTITILAIVREGDVHVTPDVGGTQAHSPAEFPEIGFDEPLLPAVLEADGDDQPGGYNVPPPPFSNEDIFPCTWCHEEMDVNYERRELVDMHDDIQLHHGPKERWCFDCHDAENRDNLRLANGTPVSFEESYRLCGQCHGTIYRDWRQGIHGRRRGFWNGAKSYLLCAHCHNPHSPAFQPLKPLPPPVRPQFLGATNEEPEP